MKNLIFAETTHNNGYYVTDGYSDNKTLRGALNAMAREIEKFVPCEGGKGFVEAVLEALKYNQTQGCYDMFTGDRKGFYVEIEHVPCASRYIYKDEEIDDIEYKDATYYICARYYDHQQ